MRFDCHTIAIGCKVAARSGHDHGRVPCLITCECGECLKAESPDELVDEMLRHLDEAHPQIAGAALILLGMSLAVERGERLNSARDAPA